MIDRAREAHSLSDVLDGLFRPLTENGYWDEEEGRIIQRLDAFNVDGHPRWTANKSLDSKLHRYGPFALMGVASWRMSEFGTRTYDEKARRFVTYYVDALADETLMARMPSYGLGPVIFALRTLSSLWPELDLDTAAAKHATWAVRHYSFRNNEDALVIVGAAACVPLLDTASLDLLSDHVSRLRMAQDQNGLFRWAGSRGAFKHQNQMYAIWGLAHFDLATGTTESADCIRRTLQYTVETRMQDDGALLWHHFRNPAHLAYARIRRLVDRAYTPEDQCLFSCHQAFFIYAAALYQELSSDSSFNGLMQRAVEWLYGRNVLNRSVFEMTEIGLPWRMMTVDGRTDWPRAQFIGSYELGAMILALTRLLGIKMTDERDA